MHKKDDADKAIKVTITLTREAKVILDQQLNRSGFINWLINNSQVNGGFIPVNKEVEQSVIKPVETPKPTANKVILPKKLVTPVKQGEPTMAELLNLTIKNKGQ